MASFRLSPGKLGFWTVPLALFQSEFQSSLQWEADARGQARARAYTHVYTHTRAHYTYTHGSLPPLPHPRCVWGGGGWGLAPFLFKEQTVYAQTQAL
jgi:hypothetical protein